MNSNIEKILSISAGVLLFAIALTVFYSSYTKHMDYINSSVRVFEEDMMVKISEEEQDSYITGSEIIHRIIEAKSNKEILDLQSLYSIGNKAAVNNSPEVWIDGKKAELVEISGINPAGHYQVRYDTDSYGNIIRIDFSLR